MTVFTACNFLHAELSPGLRGTAENDQLEIRGGNGGTRVLSAGSAARHIQGAIA
jgi:hypothetical protein